MTELRGIIAALVTPFTDGDEAVDEARLRALVDRLIDFGVDGLVACASTGEFATMTAQERVAATDITIEQAAGRCPVIVNTGATTTAEAVRLSQDAERRGAAAVMPVAPYYDALRLEETYAYHATIANGIAIPIVAYNHPDSTGVNLPPDFVGRMAREIPNVQYVKDSSADLLHLAELCLDHGEDIRVLSGMDAFLLPALEFGAVGGVLGAANFLAPALVELWSAWSSGRHDRAAKLWPPLSGPLFMILRQDRYSFQAVVKAATRLSGLDVGQPRLPLAPLGAADERRVTALLRSLPAVAA